MLNVDDATEVVLAIYVLLYKDQILNLS